MRSNVIYIVLSAIALLLFSVMNYIKGWSFDFDETFSLAMIEHSFSDICTITARDFHPPLSYFILKIFSWIIEPFLGGDLYIYRQTAVVGYFIAFFLCMFPIRRLWGKRVSIITILLFILTPISFYIYSNFRMYAWAMPFVLGSFVYAVDAYRSNTKWAWIKLSLFTLAAMYTHYYALIASFVIYVILFFFLLQKKEKSAINNYLISGVGLIVLYLPWLYFFLGQLATVKEDYWIGTPALSDIIFAVQYYFTPKYYTEKYVDLLSNSQLLAIIPLLLLSVLAIVGLAYYRVKNREEKANVLTSVFAFAVLLVSLAMVMLYTYLVSPVYHIRYLMCYFGLFALGFAICIDIVLREYKKLGALITLAFFCLLISDFAMCCYFNTKRNNPPFLDNLSGEIYSVKEKYYADESAFTDMAYLTVLYPQNDYYLLTDDNPKTRLIIEPYIVADTICPLPFTNLKKVKTLDTQESFIFMTKEDINQSDLLNYYQVTDTLDRGTYRMKPLR